MKKKLLFTLALLLTAAMPFAAYAAEDGNAQGETIASSVEAEAEYWSVRAPLPSEHDFLFRFDSEIEVRQVNGRNWVWIVHEMMHEALLEDEYDWNMDFFYNFNLASRDIPHLETMLYEWEWDPWAFVDYDIPVINLATAPGASIVFDFMIGEIKVLSWGGETRADAERMHGYILPGMTLALPGAHSFTAILVEGSDGVGANVDRGTVLILVEVLGEDGRRAPVYTFNPDDNVPRSWALPYVNRAREMGIIPSYLGLDLRRHVTRAEFAAFVVAMYEELAGAEIEGRVEFSDTVDANAEKLGYIGAVLMGAGGVFNPMEDVSREAAAAILARLLDVMEVDAPARAADFGDADEISEWNRDAVLAMHALGVMGAQDGNFEPQRLLTREETIMLMVRLFDALN